MDLGYDTYERDRLSGKHGKMGSWELVFPYLAGRKTLDIGCSDGLYLEDLCGESVGVEQVAGLVEKARGKGLNVIRGDGMECVNAMGNEEFEAVLFSHVMEHLECPMDALREIRRILVSEGVLVLGLPTERNIFRSVLRWDYFAGTHLYAFSARNCERLLELHGFVVEAIVFDLPKCSGRFGRGVHTLWNFLPFPKKEYLSMAYWMVARKV